MSRLRAERDYVLNKWSEWDAAERRREAEKEARRREEDGYRGSLADEIVSAIETACVERRDGWNLEDGVAVQRIPASYVWHHGSQAPAGWHDDSTLSGVRTRVLARIKEAGFRATFVAWGEDVVLELARPPTDAVRPSTPVDPPASAPAPESLFPPGMK